MARASMPPGLAYAIVSGRWLRKLGDTEETGEGRFLKQLSQFDDEH